VKNYTKTEELKQNEAPLIKTILASRKPGVPMLVIEDIADGGGACPASPPARELP
jgi:hypothetical protein